MDKNDLIELRKRFRWTQAEAAVRLGCSKRSIANWEKGVHAVPAYIALAAAAVCMNLPPYGRHDD